MSPLLISEKKIITDKKNWLKIFDSKNVLIVYFIFFIIFSIFFVFFHGNNYLLNHFPLISYNISVYTRVNK